LIIDGIKISPGLILWFTLSNNGSVSIEPVSLIISLWILKRKWFKGKPFLKKGIIGLRKGKEGGLVLLKHAIYNLYVFSMT